MAARKKENEVLLKTFESWGKGKLVGYETMESGGITKVVKMWCEVCRKNKAAIQTSMGLKGQALTAALTFVEGTTSIKKSNVGFAN